MLTDDNVKHQFKVTIKNTGYRNADVRQPVKSKPTETASPAESGVSNIS